MESLEYKFSKFTDRVCNICSQISIRQDENGFYIFALGLKETHTLQMIKNLLKNFGIKK